MVRLGVITRLNLDPDMVLREAVGRCPGGVIVCGYAEDGDEYFASSISDGPEALWMIERLKRALLSTPEEWDGNTHPRKA